MKPKHSQDNWLIPWFWHQIIFFILVHIHTLIPIKIQHSTKKIVYIYLSLPSDDLFQSYWYSKRIYQAIPNVFEPLSEIMDSYSIEKITYPHPPSHRYILNIPINRVDRNLKNIRHERVDPIACLTTRKLGVKLHSLPQHFPNVPDWSTHFVNDSKII